MHDEKFAIINCEKILLNSTLTILKEDFNNFNSAHNKKVLK